MFKFGSQNKSLLAFVGSTELADGSYVSPFSRMQRSSLGHFSSVGWFCVIDDADIGAAVSIASHCAIGGPQHLMKQPCQRLSERYLAVRGGATPKRCRIGDDVWIGAHAIIAAGVSVGTGCVIGANSFVNQDLPPYSIAVGTPARVVRARFEPGKIDALLAVKPWRWSNEELIRFAEIYGDTWTVDDLKAFSSTERAGSGSRVRPIDEPSGKKE